MQIANKKLFPIFLKLEHKDILIVGGGKVAYEKLLSLKNTLHSITIIADRISEKIIAEKEKGEIHIHLIERKVELTDLENRYLIIIATDNPTLNTNLVLYARQKKIWVNSVDDPKNCDFYTASVLDRGPVRVAISTEGRFAGLSRTIRRVLDLLLPVGDEALLNQLTEVRSEIRNQLVDFESRNKILKEILVDLENRYFKFKTLQENNRNGRAT